MNPLIPEAWTDAIASWAPYLLGALVMTTVLVHFVLRPLAHALERKAATTPAQWDDGLARNLVAIFDAMAIMLRAIAAWLPRLVIGGSPWADPPGSPKSPRPRIVDHIRIPVERCAQECDHGSRCVLPVGHQPPDRHETEHGCIAYGPPSSGALGLVLLVAAAACSSALTSGCSAGPQTPVTTTPQNISCTWHISVGQLPAEDASVTAPSSTDATAGVVVSDNDCSIDRSAASADPETTGNDNRGARVDAELPVDVSAVSGGS